MTRAPGAPGPIRRLALTTYRRLPRRARLALLHTFAPSYTVGSLCLIEHDGRLLMLRQRHRRGWTLPGGLLDRGEHAEEAAVREVKEETGLDVEVGLPIGIVVDPRARRVDVLFHIPLDEPVVAVANSEALEAAWLLPADAGPTDEPTAEALATFRQAALPGARTGRAVLPSRETPPPGQ